jgi:hypothetical protein
MFLAKLLYVSFQLFMCFYALLMELIRWVLLLAAMALHSGSGIDRTKKKG